MSGQRLDTGKYDAVFVGFFDTPPPIDRQVIFSITPSFSMVLTSVQVYKSRSSLKKIIPLADFLKNRFFTIFKEVADFSTFWLLGA